MSKFKVEITAVGWGGAGGSTYYGASWGWWGGEVIRELCWFDCPNWLDVYIWQWWKWCRYKCNMSCNGYWEEGGYTCIEYKWTPYMYAAWWKWWFGNDQCKWLGWCSWNINVWFPWSWSCAWGWWGAGEASHIRVWYGSWWWCWKYWFGWWGGWWLCYSCSESWFIGRWVDWGGNWWTCYNSCCYQWCNWANWWWWGWSLCCCPWGNGWNWLVEICYPLDWSWWFSWATWGDCCYECNGMMIHRFNNNGTFSPLYWVYLNKSRIVLTTVWQTEQLIATKEIIEWDIVWSSSDESIATVSQTWLVTCVTPWTCVITATCGEYSASCSVMAAKYVDFLLVAWWWGGGWWTSQYTPWGWWGGWGIIYCTNYTLECSTYPIIIWTWGSRWWSWTAWGNWWNSCFGTIKACWWGWWGGANYIAWKAWWSWWWGACGNSGAGAAGGNVSWQWNVGWKAQVYSWWGWGWAWAAWRSCTYIWGTWGAWKAYDISGSSKYYWWWGWWGSYSYCASWTNGCGSAWYWCYWWGWCWQQYNCWTCYWWYWCPWVFILRYPTSCWYDMSGWTKYTCWDYTIHCFTSSWTLTVN